MKCYLTSRRLERQKAIRTENAYSENVKNTCRSLNTMVIGSIGTGRGYNANHDTLEPVFIVKKRIVVYRTTKNFYQFLTGRPYSSKNVIIRNGAELNGTVRFPV
jgi:hypothetical protein